MAPATLLAESATFEWVALATYPVTLAPTMPDNPDPLPVNTPVLAVIFAATILPFTFNPISVPVLVILGCALAVTVTVVTEVPVLIAYVALATVPVTFAPVIELNPLPLPVNIPELAVKLLAVILPVRLSVLLHTLALLVPKINTEFAEPAPKLGSASERFKN